MNETVNAGWWSDIRRRAREHDVERVILFNRSRNATLAAWLAARARAHVPALLGEYVKVLAGAMLGFWLLAWGLAALFGAPRVYTYAVLAIVFSGQAAYYKRQLATNPDFQVRRCNCGGARRDSTERVLSSGASAVAGVPISLLGTVLYVGLIGLLLAGHTGPALLVAGAAVLVSGFLAHHMIARVRGLCSTCINIAALNVLILGQLVR